MGNQKYLFELEFLVRDYECDLLGIVNNAIYLHYLEHARHEFLHSIGLNFAKMHTEGTDAIVTRIEIDYKLPLRSCDEFVVRLNLHQKGKLRFVFDQDIYRVPDERLILQAKTVCVCLQNGKPIVPDMVLKSIEKIKL